MIAIYIYKPLYNCGKMLPAFSQDTKTNLQYNELSLPLNPVDYSRLLIKLAGTINSKNSFLHHVFFPFAK